jgi:hypothetical protein
MGKKDKKGDAEADAAGTSTVGDLQARAWA